MTDKSLALGYSRELLSVGTWKRGGCCPTSRCRRTGLRPAAERQVVRQTETRRLRTFPFSGKLDGVRHRGCGSSAALGLALVLAFPLGSTGAGAGGSGGAPP